jgi:hypothetical protein
MKIQIIDNYYCLIGENKKENWKILSEAKPNYLFFHLNKFPSCFVILQTDVSVKLNIIRKCAQICLENTKTCLISTLITQQ